MWSAWLVVVLCGTPPVGPTAGVGHLRLLAAPCGPEPTRNDFVTVIYGPLNPKTRYFQSGWPLGGIVWCDSNALAHSWAPWTPWAIGARVCPCGMVFCGPPAMFDTCVCARAHAQHQTSLCTLPNHEPLPPTHIIRVHMIAGVAVVCLLGQGPMV